MGQELSFTPWSQDIINGTLLAGLLVGMWEWNDLLRRRWFLGSRLCLTLGIPVVLVGLSRWGPFEIPFMIFLVADLALWVMIPHSLWQLLGSTLLIAGFAASATQWTAQRVLEMITITLLSLAFARLIPYLKTLKKRIGLYVIVSSLALLPLIPGQDAVSDVLTSIIIAGFTVAYIVERADRMRQWEEDIYRAEHDALTGAFTRYGLKTWMGHLSPSARSAGMIIACDLDDFKWFNDTWGHDVGDQVLQAFAHRIRTELRAEDALVRPGGDEFTIWMPNIAPRDASGIVERLHNAVTKEPYTFPTGSFDLGVSVGWAVGTLSDDTAHIADQNLLRAKRQGKNRVISAPDLSEIAGSRKTPTAQIGWLADAAQAFWAQWSTAAVLTDAAGTIVAVNAAYEQLTGRTGDELVAQKPGINSAGETPSHVYEALWQRLQDGKTWHGHLKNRRPDGTLWWAYETLVPIAIGSQVIGYWGTVQECPAESPVPVAFPLSDAASDVDTPEGDFLRHLTFQAVFQPVVDLVSESVIGQEALIRPRYHGQILSPLPVFARAQRAGVLVQLDGLCLQTIIQAIQGQGPWPGSQTLFVNVVSATLKNPPRFRRHWQDLREIVPPNQLVIEVSERHVDGVDWETLTQPYPEVIFAQDDVGAGESDLARLVRWHPGWIKIDIALVRRIGDDRRSRTLIQTLTDWAHDQGMRVIAEGVETESQATLLRQWGVDAAQGYFWAHPMPQWILQITR
ncbi:EAL domain-containing protein [Sulfobacillus thermosulfidooxidans]|uniref:EAL domain-containing protein n=1 Tax=Sulfobacillus thermosulfidooxidans TaxID=28034 RepID=UPI0006B51734|nr:EAL domain-containing protein [Sulfobacillus thermosulfidooxidans]